MRLLLSVAVFAFAGPYAALAGNAATVLVVEPKRGDTVLSEAFSRLCGELHMYGWRTEVVGADTVAEDRAKSSATDVVATVFLLRKSGLVIAEVWIASGHAGEEGTPIAISGDGKEAPNRLAVRAADALRSALQAKPAEVTAPKAAEPTPASPSQDAPSPPSKEVASLGQVQSTPPENPRSLSLAAGMAVGSELGALGSGVGPSFALEWRGPRRWGVCAWGIVPLMGQGVADTRSTASVRQEIGLLALTLRLVRSERVRLDWLVGIGVTHWTVRGQADAAPWAATSSAGWFSAATTGARVRYKLTERFGISLAAMALLLRPTPVIDLADASHRATMPLTLATAGMDFEF